MEMTANNRARYRQEKARTVQYLQGGGGQPMFLTLEDFYEACQNNPQFLQPRVENRQLPPNQPPNIDALSFHWAPEFSTSNTGSLPVQELYDMPDSELW